VPMPVESLALAGWHEGAVWAAPTGSTAARQIQRLTDWLLRYWLVSVYQTISTSIATRGPAAR
jgi:hypothetical protein